MSCVKPLTAYFGGGGSIVFDKNKSRTKVPFQLPCGRCIGCKIMKAQEWAQRCMHEKRMHTKSCYLTLTYDDEHLPEGSTLMKRDLQLFFKRLRKKRFGASKGNFRYFGAGEYGERTRRPHYHILCFGVDFPDMKPIGKNGQGQTLYTSKELEDLWFQGFNSIGEVSFQSAMYCAKYALKKVNGEKREAGHYEMVTDDGVVYERQPEFALMSRRPGVGATYYEKYGNEVLQLDNVIIDGRKARPSRFYDTRSEKRAGNHDPALIRCKCIYCRNKRLRKTQARANKADNTPERLAVKEQVMKLAAKKKETKL